MEIVVQDQRKVSEIARWYDDRSSQKGRYTSRSELDGDDSMVRFGTFSYPVLLRYPARTKSAISLCFEVPQACTTALTL